MGKVMLNPVKLEVLHNDLKKQTAIRFTDSDMNLVEFKLSDERVIEYIEILELAVYGKKRCESEQANRDTR